MISSWVWGKGPSLSTFRPSDYIGVSVRRTGTKSGSWCRLGIPYTQSNKWQTGHLPLGMDFRKPTQSNNRLLV